mgnify:CR=1 FL=1|tara:strand:- start:612 stop:830 length:219 start_codon:yes stop_codon:yes gene_type:complete
MKVLKIGEKKTADLIINGFSHFIDVTIIDIYGDRCNVFPIDGDITDEMSWVEMEQAFTNLPLSVFDCYQNIN